VVECLILKFFNFRQRVNKLNDKEYQTLANVTAVEFSEKHSKVIPSEKLFHLLHCGMGLSTEANEFLDQLKRHIFYGKDLDEVNLREELGDMFWYMALICEKMGWDINDIKRNNINKLSKRYPNKFSEFRAEHRDLDAEREILET